MLYKLKKLHNCHQKFIYIIVLPIMNLCQIRCKDCPYFVWVHLSLVFFFACWEVENFAFHAGETYPGIPGGWVTVVMPKPLDCVTPGIVLCVCNPRRGCPIIPCGGWNPGFPSRRGTVELVDPLKQCGSPAIVLWVCNPYSEGSGIPWRGGSSMEGATLWLKSCAVLTGALTNTGPDEEK